MIQAKEPNLHSVKEDQKRCCCIELEVNGEIPRPGCTLQKRWFSLSMSCTFNQYAAITQVKWSDRSRRTMSVMVKRLLMRSRFDHQYFLQLKTSSSAMNQNTPLWTTEKSPMVKHTMKRWRGWILARSRKHKSRLL